MLVATSQEMLAQFLPGMSMMRDCAVCVLIFGAVGFLYGKVCTCSLRNVKCCSKFLLKAGYDSFETFSMVVTVHQVKDLEPGRKFCRVEAGAASFDTTEQQGANASWEESQKIKVMQGSTQVVVKVMKPGTFKDKPMGTVKLRILEDLMGGKVGKREAPKFPEKQWYTLLNSKNRSEGSVKLSFLNTGSEKKSGGEDKAVDAFADSNLNPIAHAHLMNAASALGRRGVSITGTKRVQVFAKACEGYLRKANAWGRFDTKYFKAVRIKTGKWFMCWWSDKAQAEKKPPEKPEGQIAIPAITQVMNHPQERQDFIIRYKNRDGSVKDLFLQRVDLDRNIWVELLQAFVLELRQDTGRNTTGSEGETSDVEKGRRRRPRSGSDRSGNDSD